MLTFLASWIVLEVIIVAGQKYGILLWIIAHLSFFLFFVIVILLNIAGASLFGVGLIVTIPISSLMTTAIYRQLDKS